MLRRIRRLRPGWIVTTLTEFVRCSNVLTSPGDEQTRPLRRPPSEGLRKWLWWIWRTILLLLSWEKRYIFSISGEGEVCLACQDAFGHTFICTGHPVMPAGKGCRTQIAVLMGYEPAKWFVVQRGTHTAAITHFLEEEGVELDIATPSSAIRL